MPIIGHVQIAGVPDRFEPDETQKLNYPFLLEELGRCGWKGSIGCEYTPREGAENTEAGMGWMDGKIWIRCHAAIVMREQYVLQNGVHAWCLVK